MDFIKEAILTFSKKDKEEFEYFLSRKQQKKTRKDVAVFHDLFHRHTSSLFEDKSSLTGQNYHAIRKRLAKEISHYLVLKKSALSDVKNQRESKLVVAQYFMDLEKYNVAWDLLEREEKRAEKYQIVFLDILIQRMKLKIMPYYGGEYFEATKHKIHRLHQQQQFMDDVQMSFIQIRNELRNKMNEGSTVLPSDISENVMAQYGFQNDDRITPDMHIQIVNIMRSEFLIRRKYGSLVKSISRYYSKIIDKMQSSVEHIKALAQLEYIMAHSYFNVRDFEKARKHTDKLFECMQNNEVVYVKYLAKYASLTCSIHVFLNELSAAIEFHERILENEKFKLSEKQVLNMTMNLIGYYCTANAFSKANKLLLYMTESEAYYQKQMGREWLLRKELIRALVQLEFGNSEICLQILNNLKQKHESMLVASNYEVVIHYINIIISYVKNPHSFTQKDLLKMEEASQVDKNRIFGDPKLLAFYAWLKSKVLNQDLYVTLLEEYERLNTDKISKNE